MLSGLATAGVNTAAAGGGVAGVVMLSEGVDGTVDTELRLLVLC